MMAQSPKCIALTAAAFMTVVSPFGAAQAQSGYDYVFWPLCNAMPAPAASVQPPPTQAQALIPPPYPAPAPAPYPVPASVPVSGPRHGLPDLIPETTEVRYAAPGGTIGRPAYGSPQSVIIGVGY
jgi:hypothetical protein